MSASPESLALLERAAELRAAGTHWADAAKQLAVAHDELRRLAAENARDYERLSRRARADLHRQAVGAVVTTLINLMRSADPGVSLLAATTFVRYDSALLRHRGKAAGVQRERDAARRLTLGAENVRAQDVQESAKVQNRQGVAAANNGTQSGAPTAPPPCPKATPAGPKPTATVQVAPTSAKTPPPSDESARRARLVERYALGRGAPPPLVPDDRLNLEIQRLAGRFADGT